MPATQRTVTHTFTNADGTPASGNVTFNLSKRMTNGGTSILPGEVTATLTSGGAITVSLWANNDTGTTPADARWKCVFRIAGLPQDEYFISVPSGSGAVDLGTLLPGAEQVQ